MPAKHTVNVSVTEYLAGFVAAQVASGRFGTVSEVVQAGLRLLERDLQGSLPAGADGHAGPLEPGPGIKARAENEWLAKREPVP